jgi:hypothetical protein
MSEIEIPVGLDASGALSDAETIATGVETSIGDAARQAAEAIQAALAELSGSLVLDIPAPDLTTFQDAITSTVTGLSDTLAGESLVLPVSADLGPFQDAVDNIDVPEILVTIGADLVNFSADIEAFEIPEILIPVGADMVNFASDIETFEIPEILVPVGADMVPFAGDVEAFEPAPVLVSVDADLINFSADIDTFVAPPVTVTVDVDTDSVAAAFADLVPPPIDIVVTTDLQAVTDDLPQIVGDVIGGLDSTIVVDVDTGALDQIPADFASALNELDFTPIPEGISDAIGATDLSLAFTPNTDALLADLGALDIPPVPVTFDPQSSELESSLADLSLTIPAVVDADVLLASLEALELPTLIVPTTVDQGDLSAQLDAIVVPELTIPVTADTGDADASLQTLSDDASSASVGIGGVGSASSSAAHEVEGFALANTALSSATKLAAGNASGASHEFGSLFTSFGKGTVIGASLAAVYGGLFSAGEQLVAGQQRFNTTFGDTAKTVRSINFGGLKGDLVDLAESSGNSSAKLEAAIANVGRFGQASNASKGQISETTNAISALALRTSVLRPELGEAGDIANRLGLALSRGGRFALNYGLSLDPVQIKQRAFNIALRDGRTEITQFDRITAGAQLSAQQLGNTVGGQFATGVQNATVQMRILRREVVFAFAQAGAPLVQPTIDALHSLTPAVGGIAKVLGELAGAAIPVVTAGFRVFGTILGALEPPLHLVATLLQAIPTPILTGVAAMFLYSRSFGLVRDGFGLLGGGLRAVQTLFTDFSGTMGRLGSSVASGARSFAGLSEAESAATVATTDAALANDDLALSQTSLVAGSDAVALSMTDAEAAGLAYGESLAAADTEQLAFIGGSDAMILSMDAATGSTVATDAALAGLGATETVVAEESLSMGAAFSAMLGPIGLIAIGLFAAGSALGIFGDEEDTASKKTQQLIDKFLDLQSTTSQQFTATQQVTQFLDSLATGSGFANKYGDALRVAGISQKELNAGIRQGGDAFNNVNSRIENTRDTLGHIISAQGGFINGQRLSAEAAQRLKDQLGELNTTLDESRTKLRDSANETVREALANKVVTDSSLRQLEAENGLTNRQRDRVEVAKLLVPLIQRQAAAQQTAAQQTAEQAARQQVLNSQLGGSVAAWNAFAVGVVRGTITTDQFANEAQRLGVDMPTLQKVIDGVTAAVGKFANEVTGKLPQISDAFKAVASASNIDLGSSLQNFGSLQKEQADTLISSLHRQADASKLTAVADVASIDQRIRARRDLFTAQQRSGQGDQAALLSQLAGLQAQRSAIQLQQAGIEADAKTHAAKLSAAVGATNFDLSGFAGFLAGEKAQIQNFFSDVNTIAAAGQPELAAKLLEIGPAAGSALASSLAAAKPEVQQAFTELLTPEADPSVLLNRLQAQDKQIKDFTSNLKFLIQRGFGDLAVELAEQGPVAGGGTTQALVNQVFGNQTDVATQLNDFLRGGTTQGISEFNTFASSGALAAAFTAQGLGPDLIAKYVPGLHLAGFELGKALPDGAGQGIDAGAPPLGAKARHVIEAINEATGGSGAQAGQTLTLPRSVAAALVSAGGIVEQSSLPSSFRGLGGKAQVTFKEGIDPAGAIRAAFALADPEAAANAAGLPGKSRKTGKDISDDVGKGTDFGTSVGQALLGAGGTIRNTFGKAGFGNDIGLAIGRGVAGGLQAPATVGTISAAALNLGPLIAGSLAAEGPLINGTAALIGAGAGTAFANGIALGTASASGRISQSLAAAASNASASVIPIVTANLSVLPFITANAGTAAGQSFTRAYGAQTSAAAAASVRLVQAVSTPTFALTPIMATQGTLAGASFAQGISSAGPLVANASAGLARSAASGFSGAGLSLFAAGVSIEEGLAGGLRSGFIRFVAAELARQTQRIKELKGPPEKDRILLEPSGRLIMEGLTSGLETGFRQTENFLTSATGRIGKAVDAQPIQITKPIELTAAATRQFTTLGALSGGAFVDEIQRRSADGPLVDVGIATPRVGDATDLAAQVKQLVVSLTADGTIGGGGGITIQSLSIPVTAVAAPGVSRAEAQAQGTVQGEAAAAAFASSREITAAIRNI